MTIFQRPNKRLIAAIATLGAAYLLGGEWSVILEAVGLVALITWAGAEAEAGANWFRKGLGWVTLVPITLYLIVRLGISFGP